MSLQTTCEPYTNVTTYNLNSLPNQWNFKHTVLTGYDHILVLAPKCGHNKNDVDLKTYACFCNVADGCSTPS